MKEKGIWIGILVPIIFVMLGFVIFWNKDDDTSGLNSLDTKSDVATETSDEPVTTQKEEETEPEQTQTQTGEHGTYTDYSPELVDSEDDVVLFFKANWCPTCSRLDANLDENEFPENLTVLKVNYDTEQELKQRYDIAYQHTLVHVDRDGNIISKWSGGYDLESILERI